ncbi:hypothetical protein SJ593_26770, partial [Citrobacter freundii]|nr:hypothetical protein [Citrobacter freundii]
HGDVLMWLMKTLLTSGCTNQRGAGQPTFYPLIASIQKHCDKVIIEGIENREHLGILREVGVWGLQGYLFESVPFKNVDSLL